MAIGGAIKLNLLYINNGVRLLMSDNDANPEDNKAFGIGIDYVLSQSI